MKIKRELYLIWSLGYELKVQFKERRETDLIV